MGRIGRGGWLGGDDLSRGWGPSGVVSYTNCLFLFGLVKVPAQLNNRVTGLRMQAKKLKIVKRNPHRQCYNFCSIRHCFFDFLLCTQHVLSLVWRNSELDKCNTKGCNVRNQSYILKITNIFSASEAKTEVLIIRLSSRGNCQDHHPPPLRKVLENFSWLSAVRLQPLKIPFLLHTPS